MKMGFHTPPIKEKKNKKRNVISLKQKVQNVLIVAVAKACVAMGTNPNFSVKLVLLQFDVWQCTQLNQAFAV